MAKKSLFWTVTVLLTLVAVYILVVTVVLPVAIHNPLPAADIPKSEAKAINETKKSDKPGNANNKGTGKDGKKTENTAPAGPVTDPAVANSREELTAYFELKKTESLLRSRYNLSSEDSIYLVLDLAGKIARLEMKGIPLHDSDISEIWISNSIKNYHTDALLRWIARPFTLKNAESTIERVQFLVKVAPKDTIEASKMETSPAIRKVDDVYIVMNFDRNLQLVIQQAEKSEGPDKAKIDSLKSSIFKRETAQTVKALKNLKRDPVMPKIVITLPKTDAITLYRALPQRPKMVLKM